MTREKNKRRERERNTGQSENRKWEREVKVWGLGDAIEIRWLINFKIFIFV